jgi:hypothetical protein
VIEYPVTADTDLFEIERRRCRLIGVKCTTVCAGGDVVVVDGADTEVAPQPARSPAAINAGSPSRNLFTT